MLYTRRNALGAEQQQFAGKGKLFRLSHNERNAIAGQMFRNQYRQQKTLKPLET